MEKAQGSIEYLLLVSAGILTAVFVVVTVINIISPAQVEADDLGAKLFCSRKPVQLCYDEKVTVNGVEHTCAVDSTNTKCVPNTTPGSGALQTCSDGVLNQDEIGPAAFDCGGVCLGCTGYACTVGADCQSGSCVSNLCT